MRKKVVGKGLNWGTLKEERASSTCDELHRRGGGSALLVLTYLLDRFSLLALKLGC